MVCLCERREQRDPMQKILDSTQTSLNEAFASLAKNAQRQRKLYLAAVGALMAIVIVAAFLVVVLAAAKQLEYRRSLATRYAVNVALLLQAEVSFLRHTELAVQYYEQNPAPQSLPAGVEASILQTGKASGDGVTVGTRFDVLVPKITRDVWGASLSEKLSRLYEIGQSTVATQQAFDLNDPAILMVVGLRNDYALIVPSVTAQTDGSIAPLHPGDAVTLRSVLLHELLVETGQPTLAKNQRLWLGPYIDPLLRVPVMTALCASYDGDTPTALVAMILPVNSLMARLRRPESADLLLLLSNNRRAVVSSPPVDAATASMLRTTASQMPDGVYKYTRDGVLMRKTLIPGLGSIVGYLPWRVLLAELGWQLAAIAGAALLLVVGIALVARFWGLRLLRSAYEETSRALENEAINHVLVSATPIGLCILRRSDFSILTANALVGELLHSESSASTLPPHLAQMFRTETAAGTAPAEDARIVVFRAPALPDQDGVACEQILQLTCAPGRYAGEAVLFCAVLDVSMQHALEQQLRSAQQATESTLRARSTFFAAMSHEIRTPLNVLLGNLELLARAPGLESHEQRLLSLNTAAEGLRGIVNDILDFSKIDAGEMKLVIESFSPITALENLLISYAPMMAGRPIRFYSYLSPTLDQVLCGDRARIAQIVNNLLGNAQKFTSRGKIVLSAEVREEREEREEQHDRSVLYCRVSDSGIGMNQEQVARIFHPFVQGESSTSSRYGGTGLGLSICASLCKMMGGEISVESVQGVGSAFSVSLPLARPRDVERTPVATPAPRGNVMVLCQEEASAEIVNAWLKSVGWVGHSVGSVQAAEQWLRSNRPDAMVVSGEYDLGAVGALRAVRPVGVAWVRRRGPHRPTPGADGVFEVGEFSHQAFLSAVEMAANLAKARVSDNLVANGVPSAPPIAADPSLAGAPNVAAQNAPSAAKPLLGLAILVAEDNPLNQSLILEQLTALGCEPILAGDGQQALAVLENTEVDVVLTDIHMPIMDGYALLAALRRQYPGLPVMAFSAVSDVEQMDAWQERGFDGHIPKPTSLKELGAALDTLCANESTSGSVEPDETPDRAGEPGPELDEATINHYVAMLKDHLATDLPKLSAIVEHCDRQALRDWAHSAGGAFLIVGKPQFAAQCRELQSLCHRHEHWTTQMATLAMTLHEGLRSHFGLDEASLH